MQAFGEAKAIWLDELARGTADAASDQKYRALAAIVGPDPLPYGIEANRATLEALVGAAFRQGLIPRPIAVAECFVDPDTPLTPR
jgi:4,5-dihydroxyphthalate decarboxylase